MIDAERLKILTDAAKYDVSCSSSGSSRRNNGGLGNACIAGICHSFTQDGRCISLLKILMSNKCRYDCQYCANRCSNDVPRASATPEEIAELVVSFYKRNYIEGLFLSSAVDGTPDKTMENLLDAAILLRKKYMFNGYIHLKGIPNADPETVRRAGLYADRMSFNIELPSENSLKLLAPQKTKDGILKPMKFLKTEKTQGDYGRGKFLPAGQTTQMIVGASPETDGKILRLTEALYRQYSLKRVYFSSYVPTNVYNPNLPVKPVGLLREHRLYQADWLLRFYGFGTEEIIGEDGNLDTELDPKCAYALRNMQNYPVEINTAPLEVLVRVPGIGIKSAYKIDRARRYAKLTFDDLKKMRVVLKRAAHFITLSGKFYGSENLKNIRLFLAAGESVKSAEQLTLFSSAENALSAATGEI